MAKTKKIPATKIRLEVTDINLTSNTIMLEGATGDLRYVMMIDAELDQKMTVEAVIGDKWDVTLYNAVKLTKPKKAVQGVTTAKGTTVAKGSTCPGSGGIVTKANVFVEKASITNYYAHKVTKTTCPECNKKLAVNGGYNGKPYTLRKHNV